MATMAFNRFFEKNSKENVLNKIHEIVDSSEGSDIEIEDIKIELPEGAEENMTLTDETDSDDIFTEEEKAFCNVCKAHSRAIERGAMFDARCFSLPIADTVNCVIWRQQDCVRNSIQMVAQSNFSHKELQNKSCNMLQEMLFTEKGINWNDFPIHLKRGSSVIKDENGKWFIDENMPTITENRDYIEKLINFD